MDYATTLNIDQQGRIIIPAKVRKALQLHTGDVLMLEHATSVFVNATPISLWISG
jgi:AbrB family looped-hinge helix DNA binding protein